MALLTTTADRTHTAPDADAPARRSGAFPTARAARRYWIIVGVLVGLAAPVVGFTTTEPFSKSRFQVSPTW